MTRTEKYKDKRHKLKLESLVIEATYLQSKSEELLEHAEQYKAFVDGTKALEEEIEREKNWWKHYQLMEEFKPK